MINMLQKSSEVFSNFAALFHLANAGLNMSELIFVPLLSSPLLSQLFFSIKSAHLISIFLPNDFILFKKCCTFQFIINESSPFLSLVRAGGLPCKQRGTALAFLLLLLLLLRLFIYILSNFLAGFDLSYCFLIIIIFHLFLQFHRYKNIAYF